MTQYTMQTKTSDSTMLTAPHSHIPEEGIHVMGNKYVGNSSYILNSLQSNINLIPSSQK